jgi:hypothetical protein
VSNTFADHRRFQEAWDKLTEEDRNQCALDYMLLGQCLIDLDKGCRVDPADCLNEGDGKLRLIGATNLGTTIRPKGDPHFLPIEPEA